MKLTNKNRANYLACWEEKNSPVKQFRRAFAELDWFNPLRLPTGMMSPAMSQETILSSRRVDLI